MELFLITYSTALIILGSASWVFLHTWERGGRTFTCRRRVRVTGAADRRD